MQVDTMHESRSESTIGSAILVELRDTPLAPKELKGRVQKRFKKLPAPAWNAALDELADRRLIYRHYKLGKTGKPTKTVERFSLEAPPPPPPTPEEVAKDLAKDEIVRILRQESPSALDLKKRVRAAVPRLGVKAYDEVVKDLIAALLSQRAGTVPSANEREAVLRGLRDLVEREGSGSLIAMRKLRAALRLPKDRFDAVLLDLYAKDTVILHHHDHVASLSEEEREALVDDQYGNHYVGVALRGGS